MEKAFEYSRQQQPGKITNKKQEGAKMRKIFHPLIFDFRDFF
jgi:hypothetical protein